MFKLFNTRNDDALFRLSLTKIWSCKKKKITPTAIYNRKSNLFNFQMFPFCQLLRLNYVYPHINAGIFLNRMTSAYFLLCVLAAVMPKSSAAAPETISRPCFNSNGWSVPCKQKDLPQTPVKTSRRPTIGFLLFGWDGKEENKSCHTLVYLLNVL